MRMQYNPMAAIERRVGCKRRFRVRVEENVEDRLFAACDRLDEVKSPPFAVLDWDKAEQIRARAAAGESQLSIRGRVRNLEAPMLCRDPRVRLE